MELAEESLEKANPGGKITKAVKGSLVDRLTVTVKTLQKADNQ